MLVVNCTAFFWSARNAYYVRISGERDTKKIVPRELFADTPSDRKSKRGMKIAAQYASELHGGAAPRVSSPLVAPHRFSAQRNAPLSSHEKPMTILEIGQLFLSRNGSLLDPKTLRRYGITIRNLSDFFGDTLPDRIHAGELERFRDFRLASHWTPRLGTVPRRQISPRTVHSELVYCVQLLGFGFDRATETGMERLPVRKAPDVADRVRTRGRVLTIEEFWRAYEAAGSLQRAANRFQRLLALGLTTMLRSDALLRLVSDEGVRWVDLISRTVTIPPQFVKKGRGRVRKELTLPLCEWAVDSINRGRRGAGHAAVPSGVEVATAGRFGSTELMDATPSQARSETGPSVDRMDSWGAPVASVQSTLNRIAAIAGIRHFSLHDIRATGATYLLNRGVQQIVTDRLIGHAMKPNDARYYQVDQLATEAVRLFDDEWNAHRGIDGVNVVAIGAGR